MVDLWNYLSLDVNNSHTQIHMTCFSKTFKTNLKPCRLSVSFSFEETPTKALQWVNVGPIWKVVSSNLAVPKELDKKWKLTPQI